MLNNALFYYMMELISVISLRKIFQNTGLRFSSFPRLRIYDSVLIRKNAGLRKPLYWLAILRCGHERLAFSQI